MVVAVTLPPAARDSGARGRCRPGRRPSAARCGRGWTSQPPGPPADRSDRSMPPGDTDQEW